MGNTVSTDLESPDLWWAQTNVNTEMTQNSHQVPSSNESRESSSEEIETAYSIELPTYNTLTSQENIVGDDSLVGLDERNERRKANEEKMEQFRAELAKKHLARRQAIAERSKEILFLREELARQKKENEDLKESLSNKHSEDAEERKEDVPGGSKDDVSWDLVEQIKAENLELKNVIIQQQQDLNKYEELATQNHELRLNIAETQKELQLVNAQVIAMEKEKLDYQIHVTAMKDVVKVSKQLLEIREAQLQELRAKIAEIESHLADQETSMLSTNLRNEYEKQLRNMRALRTLYEQRQAASKAENSALTDQLAEITKKFEIEQTKNKELEERVEELEKDISDKYDSVQNLQSQLGLKKAECRGLQAEMLVINQLFSQIIVGFNNGQVDLDKLIKLLEENHDLLTDIVINEESTEHSSALPKMLLDLVNQVRVEAVDETSKETENEQIEQAINAENSSQEQQVCSQMCSAAEIVHNLPKVWRVLAELLSQQSGQQPVIITEDGINPCYKSIETPKGPKLVLSVSQTFIRLKDLILEKKSLEKEMTRLKQLNTHLEVRLQDQEKRLETVSTELGKTWHVVGRMQRQHQQLHTHEKILRYELAQKRKMLTELKDELEYCREKWEQAREKNSNTEEQWKKLRTEFAARKNTTVDDLNNSAESGYSDERECSSDEDSSYESSKKVINNPIPSGDASKTTSDIEDNDETSHGSDAEDLLETAFNAACTTANSQSPIDLREIINGDAEPDNAASGLSDTSEVIYLHDNSVSEAEVAQMSESYPVCDNEIQTLRTINESEEDIALHSSERTKTDLEVQIGNDSLSQVSDKIKPENVHLNKNTEDSQIPSCSETDIPSTSSSQQKPSTSKKCEEVLTKREERLRRLEEQCKQLVTKVTNTTHRGMEIYNRLETLHEQYGTDTTDSTREQQNEHDNNE